MSNKKGKAPTMADVARHAGVSSATVSRCLNTANQLTPRTRSRVLEAVATLGYAPNFSARALAAGQTNTFGAVIPTMENAVFAQGLQAFQQELERNGKTLLVASSAYSQTMEEAQVRTLVARGADALLLIGYARDSALYQFLEQRGVPALVSWSWQENHPAWAVGFDNQSAMAELGAHVIEQGHRCIACISAPTSHNDRAHGRVEGIRLAMSRGGLNPNDLLVLQTPYGIENGEAAFHEIRARAPQITAIMCGNDVLALGALRGARRAGLRVPQHISITGFDDTDIALLADPALTTVHVPHTDMGRRAAKVLIAKMSGQQIIRPAAPLKTTIKLRASLGAAPV